MASSSTGSQAPKIGWKLANVLLRKYLEAGYNTLWVGPPGIGKTALVKHVAKQMDYELVIFHPCISDPTDFKGMPIWYTDTKSGKQKAVFIPFGDLEHLLNATKPTICFFDDLIQAPDAVQASAMQLLWGGELNGKKISKHVRFVSCTNDKGHRAGGTSILEPVKGRFHGIFELVPELEPVVQYLISKKVSPVLVAFLRRRPDWVNGGEGGWKPVAGIVKTPCARSIEMLSDVINLELDKIARPIAYAAAVGHAMANEYFAFETLAARLPKIDKILSDPLSAEAPKTDEIAYAMIGALHSRMSRANIDNIYVYIRKYFTVELQAVFHFDVGQYDKSLMKTKGYVSWSRDYGDLLSN